MSIMLNSQVLLFADKYEKNIDCIKIIRINITRITLLGKL